MRSITHILSLVVALSPIIVYAQAIESDDSQLTRRQSIASPECAVRLVDISLIYTR